MQLRLSVLQVQHHQESDYDTAVDLVHYASEEVRYRIELPCGACFEVVRDITSTTTSYLEPDFDALDAGGDLHYVQHRSDAPAKETVRYRLDIDGMPKYAVITEQQWAEVLDERSACFESEMHEFAESGISRDRDAPPCSPEQLFDVLEALELTEGRLFDAGALPLSVQSWLCSLDARGWRLLGENLSVRLASRCNLARAQLALAIAAMS